MTSRPGSGLHAWRWPALVGFLGLLLLVGYLETCRRADQATRAPERMVGRAAQAMADIAERFRTGHITQTFTAALPRLLPGGARLELAAYEATETLTRTDERTVLFEMIPLGKTVSEIRVPVTYRYHLRLDDPWQLEVVGHACLVHAPPIRPSLPPAIHTDRMEKRSDAGWLRFDSAAQMDLLERSLTPTLSARAGDPDRLALVREQARQRVAAFVRAWLLREDHWRQDRFSSVTVVFADEPEARPARPTLRYSDQPGEPAVPAPQPEPPTG